MMWIRSQNRQVLINANCIDIDKEDDNCYKIYVQTEQGVFYDIGNYSTEEKVLKVLNIIEDELCDGNYLYQMPEDDEVEDYD